MLLIDKIINKKYELIKKIGEGGISVVWMAKDISKSNIVALKILKKQAISERIDDIIRFRNEAITISRLNEPGIIKVFEVGDSDDIHYIAMEYLDGQSLHEHIINNRIFSIDECINIAIQICEALKCVHDAGVIFRDLKPGNIILLKDSLQIKLIDFGLSQVREFDSNAVDEIVGTLYYMSPEQSGAIKGSVDERSDLYSFGILLYQLFTGKLPFSGGNMNSIIYQHVAKVPLKPTILNADLPIVIENIILKLMEKEPTKRYQSVDGLLKDLQTFKDGKYNFIVGQKDRKRILNFRSSLVGRDNELLTLKNKYNIVATGNGSICLIGGEAGKGKTRLCDEIRNYVYSQNGIFINAKCFSGETKTPYSVVKDIISKYLKIYSSFDNQSKEEIRARVQDKVGNYGKIIIKLNTLTEEILGPCPDIVSLEAELEQKRYVMVIREFLLALFSKRKPAVVVLDDLQWVDEGSIEILIQLISEIENYSLLIIGTYRDNEIAENHPLNKLKSFAQRSNRSIKEISLKSLNVEKIYQLVVNILYDEGKEIVKIANFLLKKSKGNPFYCIEIIKQLVNEEIIIRDDLNWKIGPQPLSSVEIASSIVDMLIKEISKLNEDEINVLSHASVIGKNIHIDFLAKLTNFDVEYILNIIDNAIKVQLLEEDPTYKGNIVFFHDRIKEAFYKKMGKENRNKVHSIIAKFIEEANIDNLENVIFSLAYHFSEGCDIEKTLKYAFPAGEKAYKDCSFEVASEYFLLSKKFCEMSNPKYSLLWLKSTIEAGKMNSYTTNYDKSISLFMEVIDFIGDEFNDIIPNKYKKSELYFLICNAYYNKGDWQNTYKFGQIGMKLIGNTIPLKKIPTLLGIIKELGLRLIYSKLYNHIYKDKRSKKNSDKYKLMLVYYEVINTGAVMNDGFRFLYGIIRAMNICESKIGWSKELSIALIGYTGLLSFLNFHKKALNTGHKAINMIKQMNEELELELAIGYRVLGYCYEWNGEYEKAMLYLVKSYDIYQKLWIIKEANVAYNGMIHQVRYMADYKKMKEMLDQFGKYAEKSQDTFCLHALYSYRIVYYKAIGEYDEAEKIGLEGLKCISSSGDLFNICCMNNEIASIYTQKGNYRKAMEYLEISKELIKTNTFLPQYAHKMYIYLAECYIFQYLDTKDSLTKLQKRTFLKTIKKECSKALKATKNLPTLYPDALTAWANYCAIVNKNHQAEIYFKKAITLCEKIKLKHGLAISLLEYGLFLKTINRKTEADVNIRNARDIFENIGDKLHSRICNEKLADYSNNLMDSTERFSHSVRLNQRMNLIINLNHEISSLLNLELLLQKIISVAIEVTGAQNCYLILFDSDVIISNSDDTTQDKKTLISQSIINKVKETGDIILSANATEELDLCTFDSIIKNNVKSVLCMPIKRNNEIIGICYMDNNISSSAFNEEDIDVLNVFMAQAAISLENAKLYNMAITDGLTGLVNHKYFKSALEKEIKKTIRYKRALSLLLCDIDYFKKVNDTYGHQTGDAVLKSIATIAKSCFRNCETIARYGGEEFVIILPETDLNGAYNCAERFRHEVENFNFTYNDNTLKLTISIGVADYTNFNDTIDDLIYLADKALYESKDNGRNRTTTRTKK